MVVSSNLWCLWFLFPFSVVFALSALFAGRVGHFPGPLLPSGSRRFLLLLFPLRPLLRIFLGSLSVVAIGAMPTATTMMMAMFGGSGGRRGGHLWPIAALRRFVLCQFWGRWRGWGRRGLVFISDVVFGLILGKNRLKLTKYYRKMWLLRMEMKDKSDLQCFSEFYSSLWRCTLLNLVF